jgi:hypothetical protein
MLVKSMDWPTQLVSGAEILELMLALGMSIEPRELSEQPAELVTIIVTGKLPEELYACEGLAAVEVFPSPNFHV